MSLVEKLKISEHALAAQPRRGGPSQPWATPRVQGSAVWASSPEGARYDLHLPVPCRLARPFGAPLLVWPVTNMLMRIQRRQRKMEALENTAVFHDVLETKWVSNG